MKDDISLFFLAKVTRLFSGHHVLGSVKSFRNQANQGLRAVLGARQSVHIGVIRPLFAGNVEQLLLGTHIVGEQDVRVLLPLVAVGERKRGCYPNTHAAGKSLANDLANIGTIRLGVGSIGGIGMTIRRCGAACICH